MKKFAARTPWVVVVALLAGAGWSRGAEPATVTYRFSHLAGSAGGGGYADGVGKAARFRAPSSIAVDIAGNAYVADRHNYVVRKITPNGVVTTLAGFPGESGAVDGRGAEARFSWLGGIAADPLGNVYVADNTAIRKISPSGEVTTFSGFLSDYGWPDAPGWHAGGGSRLVADGGGNVYAAKGSSIEVIAASGVASTLAGKEDESGWVDGVGVAARFGTQLDIALAPDGQLYVADTSNRVVRRVSLSGRVETIAGSVGGGLEQRDGVGREAKFVWPEAIAVAGDGFAYVVDARGTTLRRISPAGEVTTWLGGKLLSEAGTEQRTRLISYDTDVAIDPLENVFVADGYENSVREITPDGTVTIHAGGPGESGYADGVSAEARFSSPTGIAVDRWGNVYVADVGNCVVRKVSPGGVVSTFAGAVGQKGGQDGVGSQARFAEPRSVAVNAAGEIYVADRENHTIRRISVAGEVTTFAGMAGQAGYGDGPGAAARFNQPAEVAVDGAGNIYILDTGNFAIRKISPEGGVTTLAGGPGPRPGPPVAMPGKGAEARLYAPHGLAVDLAGNVYVADGVETIWTNLWPGVYRVSPDGVMSYFAAPPAGPPGWPRPFTMPIGLAADRRGNIFLVESGQEAIRVISPDGEISTIGGSDATAFDSDDGKGAAAGFNNPQSVAVDAAGNLYIADTDNHAIRVGVPVWENSDTRLAALAVRSRAGAGDRTLIMGFVVEGAVAHDVLVRGLGPTLTDAGLDEVVRDPKLQVFDRGELVAQNDDWSSELIPLFARLGAGTPRQGSKDAALMSSLPAGAYTAHVVAAGSDDGVALAEVYDAELGGGGKLKALAVRSRAGTGDDVLIAGFVLVGETPKTVLIRGVGPSLAQQGVSGALVDPRLRLFRGGVEIDANDDWGGAAVLKEAFSRTGAGSLEADTSKDAALLVSLEPGVYTAHVGGADGGTGVALVEVYAVE